MVFNWIAGKEKGAREKAAKREGRIGIARAILGDEGYSTFFQGGLSSPRDYDGGKSDAPFSQLRTDAIADDDGTVVAWAIGYDERDSAAAQRHWHTNVGIRRVDGGCLVNVRVVNYEPGGYVGRKAAEVLPNVPNVARKLLSLPGCTATNGGMELQEGLTELTVDDFDREFGQPLVDSNRTLPMVLIHTTEYGHAPIHDVDGFVRTLYGLANVYQIDHRDKALISKLRHLFPRGTEAYEFRSNCSTIRVYMPGLALDEGEDAYRSHPFYNQRRLYLLVGDAAKENLAPLLNELRRGFNQLQASGEKDVLDLDDIDHMRRVRDRDAVMRRYKEERSRLESANADLAKTADEVIDGFMADNELLKKQVAELQAKASKLAAKNEAMGSWKRAEADTASSAETLDELRHWILEHRLPEDLCDAMELAERLWPERIRIHPDAYDSARDYDCRPEQGFDVMVSIAEDLWDVWYGTSGSANKLAEYNRRSRYELAMCESAATRAVDKWMKMRIHEIDGKDVCVEPHVKANFGPPGKNYRAYVHFDDEHRRIDIVYSGSHLPTAGTHRQSL